MSTPAWTRTLPIGVLLLLTVSTLHAQRPISSKAGRWSVTVPSFLSKKVEQKSPINTDAGRVTMYMTLMQSRDGMSALMVSHMDYPERILTNMDIPRDSAIQVMFNGAREGGLGNVENAQLISERRITLNGLPGRSIVFRGDAGGTTIHARFDYYMDVPRLYQIGYLSNDEASLQSPEVEAMFRSFAVKSSTPAGPRRNRNR